MVDFESRGVCGCLNESCVAAECGNGSGRGGGSCDNVAVAGDGRDNVAVAGGGRDDVSDGGVLRVNTCRDDDAIDDGGDIVDTIRSVVAVDMVKVGELERVHPPALFVISTAGDSLSCDSKQERHSIPCRKCDSNRFLPSTDGGLSNKIGSRRTSFPLTWRYLASVKGTRCVNL